MGVFLTYVKWNCSQWDDIHAGLLTGTNKMKALEPAEILQSQDGSAYKTRLDL